LAFIKLHNITFGYPGRKKLFEGLSLDFEKNSFTAMMGANGSGKTTLGKIMTGIIRPSGGNIVLNGTSLHEMNLGQVGRHVGYLFQNPETQIFATTVIDELSFIMKLKNIDQALIDKDVDEILELFNLTDKKSSVTFNLSYGEKQRLALAGILINKPGYLILDEPTTGLDFLRKQQLQSILTDLLKRGTGIFIISHDEKFIRSFTGKLLTLKDGKVFEAVI
jgi:energy-coupling factor transport system ATP-binding protein